MTKDDTVLWSYGWNRSGNLHTWINQGYRARIQLYEPHYPNKKILVLHVSLMRPGWPRRRRRLDSQGDGTWDDVASIVIQRETSLLLVRKLIDILDKMDLSSGPSIKGILSKVANLA